MSEGLSAKTLDYKERAREVAEKYVRPAAAELDRTGEYGWDILEALKKYELTGIWIPSEYGGQGRWRPRPLRRRRGALAGLRRGRRGMYAVNALGSFPIILAARRSRSRSTCPRSPRARSSSPSASRRSPRAATRAA
jgi:alkylation response protein AidB-like acyl-CoA dehydrogenase